jgi:hypothetical protein
VLLSFQRSLRSGNIPGVGAHACANAQVRDEAVRKSEPGQEVVLFVPLPHDLGQANDGRARVHRYRSLDLRLGRELLAFRTRYGLTQDEVARVVGTSSAATISQWEAGRKVPDGLRRERRGAEQAPRPHGWRVRAEQAYAELSPEPSLTLSASEIGAYAFCFVPMAARLSRALLITVRSGAS